MIDTDKIVAAILAAAHSMKDAGAVNPAHFVERYQSMLVEVQKQKADATEAAAFTTALEDAILEKRSQEKS